MQFVNYLNLKANHALVLQILRKYSSSDHPDDAVASLQDNREGTDLAQLKDVTEAIKANSGLKLFQLFLGVDQITLVNIVQVKKRYGKNQSLAIAKDMNSILQHRRHTRSLLASIEVMHNKTTNSTPSPSPTQGSIQYAAKRKADKRKKERANRRRVPSKGKPDLVKKMPKKIKHVRANAPKIRSEA